MKKFVLPVFISTILFTSSIPTSVFGDQNINTNISKNTNFNEDEIQKILEKNPNYFEDLEKQEEAKKGNISHYKKNNSEIDEIDIAYQKMMERENYIVDLVSKLSNQETNLTNWEYNHNYLSNNYDEIIKDKNVNIEFIDRYIEDYNNLLISKNMPDEKPISNNNKSSYSRINAVEYANRYYSNYNPSYPDWTPYGGDCANFVSQCLYAGGKSMSGSPGSSSAQDWGNWFSYGSDLNTSNVSSTWRGANAFKSYWQSNSVGYKKFDSFSPDAYNYGYKGDAISLLNHNGVAYHTMIVVGYYGIDLLCAQHTGDQNDRLLSTINSPFIIYRML